MTRKVIKYFKHDSLVYNRLFNCNQNILFFMIYEYKKILRPIIYRNSLFRIILFLINNISLIIY